MILEAVEARIWNILEPKGKEALQNRDVVLARSVLKYHNLLKREDKNFVDSLKEFVRPDLPTSELQEVSGEVAKGAGLQISYYEYIDGEYYQPSPSLDSDKLVKKWKLGFEVDFDAIRRAYYGLTKQEEVEEKIKTIMIPGVTFQSVELSQVLDKLEKLSKQHDPCRDCTKGIKIKRDYDTKASDPLVNLTLRNMSLLRILQLVVDQTRFDMRVDGDVVFIIPRERK